MAELSRNTFVVDAQDLASAKFKAIADNQTAATSKMVSNAQRLSAETAKMATTQNSARMATFSLTQAIQDAPYGFRGVANNIEFLTQNLVTLTAQTGGAMGAMKAIGATLSGPVGILFAVSAVSAAIQFLAPNLGTLGDTAKKVKKEIEGLSDVLGLFAKNVAGAATGQVDTLYNEALANLKKLRAELASIKPEGEKVTVGRSGLVTRERVLTQEQTERQKALNEAIARQVELVNKLDDMRPGDTQRIKEATEANKKRVEETTKSLESHVDALDFWGKQFREKYKMYFLDAPAGQNNEFGRDFFSGLEKAARGAGQTIGEYIDNAEQRWERYIERLRTPIDKLPEVKVNQPPEPKFKNEFGLDLVNKYKALEVTFEDVNNFLVSSTQDAASAITDAFFGATQSIQQFFESMIKNVVRMLVEQLLVKGILSLLGSFIPGVGPATGLIGGLVGGKNAALARPQAEQVEPSKTVAKAPTVEPPKVPAITIPAPKVTVAKIPTISVSAPKVTVERIPAITIPAPRVSVARIPTVQAETPRALAQRTTESRPVQRESNTVVNHTVNVTVNGTTKQYTVKDRRQVMQTIQKSIFTERFA